VAATYPSRTAVGSPAGAGVAELVIVQSVHKTQSTPDAQQTAFTLPRRSIYPDNWDPPPSSQPGVDPLPLCRGSGLDIGNHSTAATVTPKQRWGKLSRQQIPANLGEVSNPPGHATGTENSNAGPQGGQTPVTRTTFLQISQTPFSGLMQQQRPSLNPQSVSPHSSESSPPGVTRAARGNEMLATDARSAAHQAPAEELETEYRGPRYGSAVAGRSEPPASRDSKCFQADSDGGESQAAERRM
jgi:hypothetical protein